MNLVLGQFPDPPCGFLTGKPKLELSCTISGSPIDLGLSLLGVSIKLDLQLAVLQQGLDCGLCLLDVQVNVNTDLTSAGKLPDLLFGFAGIQVNGKIDLFLLRLLGNRLDLGCETVSVGDYLDGKLKDGQPLYLQVQPYQTTSSRFFKFSGNGMIDPGPSSFCSSNASPFKAMSRGLGSFFVFLISTPGRGYSSGALGVRLTWAAT